MEFRDMIIALHAEDKKVLANAYCEILHGKEKSGFELLLNELKKHKLSKWTLVTLVQTYYRPTKSVFVKPTTTKLIIEKLELDLVYKPTPTWDFYKKYKKIILDMQKQVSQDLSPNTPAFCGFLMMSLQDL